MARGGEQHTTYENEGGVEVLVVLPDVVGVILGRLPLVHGVEVETRIVVLDGLEERSESVLKTTFVQRHAVRATSVIRRTTLGRF